MRGAGPPARGGARTPGAPEPQDEDGQPRLRDQKTSGSKEPPAPNTASQRALHQSGLPGFENQNHKRSTVGDGGEGPPRTPGGPAGGQLRAPTPSFPLACPAPRPRTPRAGRPAAATPQHQPRWRGDAEPPGPEPNTNTPLAPGARRAPRLYLDRGSGSRPVGAGGPGPFVPSSSERDEGLRGERGMGDWRRN